MHHFKSHSEFKLEWQSGSAPFRSKSAIFVPCDLEIWWMTSKKNRAPLLYYIKLCASFQIHQWIQIRMTARKRSIQVEIGDFWSRATLKFDRRPWKTTRLLFYATLNFVCHFKAVGGFKLELQSGNTQFGSKSAIVLSRVTLKFDGGLSKRIGYLSNTTSSVVHRFKAREGGGGGGGGTLKINKTPLLCCFKLCVSFHSHQWIQIQTGVTVRKRPIWVKINIFCPVWPWNLTDDLEKQ